jgi:hypothetical protein
MMLKKKGNRVRQNNYSTMQYKSQTIIKMKNLFKSVLIALLVYSMLSCSSDKEKTESFTTRSVEENKATIESAGIDLIGVLNRMRSTQTVEAIGNMIQLTGSGKSKGIGDFTGTGLYSVFRSIHGCAARTLQVNDVFESIKGCADEDPESIQEFWDRNVGTYTWNSSASDWDISPGGDKFIIKFPSSGNSKMNNATFTIYNYEGVIVENPFDEEYTGDFPASLQADLKIGSQTLLRFVFGASYNADGIPNAIACDLDFEGFKFEIDVANDTRVISASYKFMEGKAVIMKLSAVVNGLFTADNLELNTVHHSESHSYVCDFVYNPETKEYVEVYCEYTNEWEKIEFEEIAHSANAEFQLMNLAVRGDIDIKKLVDKIRIIEDQYDTEQIEEEEYFNSISEEINKYLNLRLVNINNNEILAKVEAYVEHESDWGYEDFYVSFRLTFGEESPIDMETYFGEGFDDFIKSLNDLLEDICNDYGIDYDPIDY